MLLPLTTPAVFTEAIAALLLLHVPPVTVGVSVLVVLGQTEVTPLIVPTVGSGLTVIENVALLVPHALVTKYEIVVVPPETPCTTPAVVIEAMVVLLLLHAPPVTLGVSAVVAP
jgi:hypothetical protein